LKFRFIAAFLLFGLAFGWALETRAFQAPPPPLSESDYQLLIEDTRAVLPIVVDLSDTERSDLLQALATRWDQVTGVVQDGQTLPLEPSYISSQLRADPPDLVLIDTLLSTLDGHSNSLGQIDPQDASNRLGSLLSRPEFQYEEAQPNALTDLLDRIRLWFAELLDRIIPNQINLPALPSMGLLLGVVAALTIALIFVYIIRGTARGVVAETVGQVDFEDATSMSADQALKRANTLSQQGDLRAAVRYLYLSALLTIEEGGLLRHDRSLTNRELLRLLKADPAMRSALHNVVDVFDRVWYGYQAIEQDEFRQYSQEIEALQSTRRSA
jgi:hypothetical protein